MVVPDAPSAVEKFAASALADELGKCLGARPAVICEHASRKGPMLYVGATRAAEKARGGRTWEADDDENRLIGEFLSGYYGAAAAPHLKR